MEDSDPLYGNQDHFYRNFYSRTIGIDAKGLRSFLWKYPHRLFERPFSSNREKRILEVGAGNGEHISFVESDFKEYHAVDIRLSETLLGLASSKILCSKADVSDLGQFRDSSFDRVIAMCLLAHLDKPEQALSEMRRVSANQSLIQMYIPCEPGLALRIFRRLITRIAVNRMGYLGFDLFMAREHRNSLPNLMVFIKEEFKRDRLRIRRRPWPFLGWNMNLFYIVEVEVIK